jgi:hypothetical protein
MAKKKTYQLMLEWYKPTKAGEKARRLLADQCGGVQGVTSEKKAKKSKAD